MSVLNILTIDVEDYFMVSAFSGSVRFDRWLDYESRLDRNLNVTLEILDRFNVQATFFVLGWVAEYFPGLVKEIRKRGHEVGCHSYNHRLISDLTPKEFRDDTRKAKTILEDTIGQKVSGYRAPSFSITRETMWALDILMEEEFIYDSSIFPIYHDRYGIPDFHRFPLVVRGPEGGEILEIPPSTIRLFGANIPFGGGGYFRFYPLTITDWCIRRINRQEGNIAVVYFHPWELDPEQPEIEGSFFSRGRHRWNIQRVQGKLERLLARHQFSSVENVFRDLGPVRCA